MEQGRRVVVIQLFFAVAAWERFRSESERWCTVLLRRQAQIPICTGRIRAARALSHQSIERRRAGKWCHRDIVIAARLLAFALVTRAILIAMATIHRGSTISIRVSRADPSTHDHTKNSPRHKKTNPNYG
jgi:hypothetical protein